MTLTPAQRVIALVCYDGVEPRDLVGEERELAREIFGPGLEVIPQIARKTVTLVCGRRGGKSYVLEALRLVHAMYTIDCSSAAPGQIPIALVIAPNDELRQEVVNYAVGAIRSHEGLRATLLGKAATSDAQVSKFDIRRPSGQVVGFRSGVATEGGYGGRGKSLVGVSLDEAAFFKDENYAVSDVQLLKAAIPGLLPGAQAIVPSTPWAQAGLLWDLYSTNWGHPVDAVVAHAPTTLLRPTMAAIVEEEFTKDPEYAEREFGAKFMAIGNSLFFPSWLIEKCLRPGLELPNFAEPGDLVAAAVDLGFRSDSSSMAGVRKIGEAGGKILLARLREMQPENGVPLKPGEVVSEFAAEAKELGCSWVMADQHYLESLREHALGLACAPAPASPDEVFVAVRTLMRDGKFFIPDPRGLTGDMQRVVRRLVQQMKEVKGKPMPGGKIAISMPRWRTGGHGDLLAATALAVYQLSGEMIHAPEPEFGSVEWEAAEKEKRREAVRAKVAQKGARRLI